MRQPFCITGAGRSGSTYLYLLLRDHPHIALTNESKLLDFLITCETYVRIPAYEVDSESGMQGMINEECIEDFAPAFATHGKRAVEQFYETHFRTKNFTHWGDKIVSLPSAARLRRLYPAMKFVVLVRDVRDQICSLRAYRSDPQIQKLHDTDNRDPVVEHAERWAGKYRDLLENARDRHVVHYEDLVRDPGAVVDGILGYLGLHPHAACRQAIETNDTFSGHSTSDSPTASIGRWRDELSDAEHRVINGVCGDLMARLGYR